MVNILPTQISPTEVGRVTHHSGNLADFETSLLRLWERKTMTQTGGWLARAARRFSELMSGTTPHTTSIIAPTPDPEPVPSPIQHAAESQQPLPPSVQVDSNGRYLAGGYSFSTLKQATSHAARLAHPLAPSTSKAILPSLPMVAPARAEPQRPLPPGVQVDSNGRYLGGGYSFSTLKQAESRAARPAQAAPSSTLRTIPPPLPAIAPVRMARDEPRWVGEMSALTIDGRTITTHLVYYGTPTHYEARHDKSRIDPVLSVDLRGDPSGSTLDYCPSYSDFEPRARATYLDWLDGGRSNAAIPIGYVFVFFYGLEQRLFVDDARDEAKCIFAEVRRLLSIYGENYSFQNCASRLLALSALYEKEDDAPPTPSCAQGYDLELPLDLRIRLGQRLRDDRPFSADDALRWVLAQPDVYLRTPGQRCFDELRELWKTRFTKRHPHGLRIRRPRTTLRPEYKAASGTFSMTLPMDLPDISRTSAPLASLRAMLDGCMNDLSPYSYLVGRDPEARRRLRGDLLLPAELRSGRHSLDACRSVLEEFARIETASGVLAIDLARALDLKVDAAADKLSAASVRQMGLALDALGFGYEPDRRYGPATVLRTNARVCVFSAPEGAPVDHERPAYTTARGMVEVAMLAALSDGEAVAAEFDTIERHLRAAPDLAEHEIARLMACGRALAANPPKVRTALKRLADIPPASRATLAASAVEAVLADGRILPDEVRFLEALHTALDLPLNLLYSTLHRSSADDGPVEVIQGEPERLVPLPSERHSDTGVSIDAVRLERIRGETTQVSAMLAAIFTDEEPEPAPPALSGSPAIETAFEGLDGAHAELLTRLLTAPLARTEFDAVAAGLRLMPDGAIEALNEWGFDRFGEAIIEDDDDVKIVSDMIHQLEKMGVDA